MKQWILIATCVTLFSGCSFGMNFWSQKAPTTPVNQTTTMQITIPSTILMYELDVADRPYSNLGEVSVSLTRINPWGEEPTQAHVEAKLKEEAIKKGADALIYVHYTKLGASWNRVSGIEGKAQAIKFTRY